MKTSVASAALPPPETSQSSAAAVAAAAAAAAAAAGLCMRVMRDLPHKHPANVSAELQFQDIRRAVFLLSQVPKGHLLKTLKAIFG